MSTDQISYASSDPLLSLIEERLDEEGVLSPFDAAAQVQCVRERVHPQLIDLFRQIDTHGQETLLDDLNRVEDLKEQFNLKRLAVI